jgi:hypothetical protein
VLALLNHSNSVHDSFKTFTEVSSSPSSKSPVSLIHHFLPIKRSINTFYPFPKHLLFLPASILYRNSTIAAVPSQVTLYNLLTPTPPTPLSEAMDSNTTSSDDIHHVHNNHQNWACEHATASTIRCAKGPAPKPVCKDPRPSRVHMGRSKSARIAAGTDKMRRLEMRNW